MVFRNSEDFLEQYDSICCIPNVFGRNLYYPGRGCPRCKPAKQTNTLLWVALKINVYRRILLVDFLQKIFFCMKPHDIKIIAIDYKQNKHYSMV